MGTTRKKWTKSKSNLSPSTPRYQKLPVVNDAPFLLAIPHLISDLDNASRMATPTLEEVEGVIKGMDYSSSAGPDGFTGLFFNKGWDIIKADMLDVVLCFFGGFGYPRSLSSTMLVLIP